MHHIDKGITNPYNYLLEAVFYYNLVFKPIRIMTRMKKQQVILLVINVIGGAAVIGGYMQGLLTHTEGANALWGGISGSVRPLYGISMIAAALGYFAFLYFIMLRLIPSEVRIAGRFGFRLFYLIFVGILVPSAFWMPLTYAMINNPGNGLWVGICTVLTLVGLASCALVWTLLTLQHKKPTKSYRLAVIGSGYFCFHTAVLDMLLWPVLF